MTFGPVLRVAVEYAEDLGVPVDSSTPSTLGSALTVPGGWLARIAGGAVSGRVPRRQYQGQTASVTGPDRKR
jgi:hypothetical protein